MINYYSLNINTRDKTEQVQFTTYPGGELACKLRKYYNADSDNVIFARITKAEHIIQLILLVDMIKRQSSKNIYLNLPYHPYARQDREQDYDFSLAAITKVIDNLGLKQINVLDPHSQVVALCYHTTKVVEEKETLERFHEYALDEFKADCIVIPDLGAHKRYNHKLPIIQFTKTRNPETGKLSNHKIINSEIEQPKMAIVIDDICDGGATFINVGIEMKNKYPDVKLALVVTHGIFSKGLKELEKYYSVIFTTNSLDQESNCKNAKNLKVFYTLPQNF